MAMDRAVTAPVVSAGPMAWTHEPTVRSAGVAASSTSNVVDEVVVTVTCAVAAVRGSVAVTEMTSPFTDATCPKVAENRGAPVPARRGKVPDVGRRGGLPVRGAPPWPGRAHEPLVDGTTVTRVAVTGPPNAGVVAPEDEVPDEVGDPTAVMHDPAVTWVSDPATVLVKVVVAV